MTGRRVLALLLALSLGTLAQEYGPSAVVTYDIRSLTYRPGVIYVSPKYMTVIEFSELIDELGTSVPNLIQIKVSTSENMLFLRALRNAGSGDLVVRVAGYAALFRVVVDPRMEQPRRYVVTFPSVPQTPTRSTVNPTPAPRQESAAPVPRPAEPGGQPRASTSPSSENLPSWLSVRFTHARTGEGGTAVIYYEVKNNGQETLRLPVEGLSVRKGGIALPFRVVRTTFGQTVDLLAPGESATGAIIVPEAPEGVEVEWRLQDSKGNSYVLRTREN
jgi:hypothetical protein